MSISHSGFGFDVYEPLALVQYSIETRQRTIETISVHILFPLKQENTSSMVSKTTPFSKECFVL